MTSPLHAPVPGVPSSAWKDSSPGVADLAEVRLFEKDIHVFQSDFEIIETVGPKEMGISP